VLAAACVTSPGMVGLAARDLRDAGRPKDA